MPEKAKRPDPDVAGEVRTLLDAFNAMEDRTEDGEGRTYRFCFEVPEEIATLAGWLAFKEYMDVAGKPGVLPRPVQLVREDGFKLADWHRARELLYRAMIRGLSAERWALEDGTHKWLFPAETREQNRASVALDDDIPF